MSWRGQGGKRAKGRRGDQDPEVENTAWLAELEEAAAQDDDEDDDEDDWASTLRGRRPPAPPPQPPPEPEWAPPPDQRPVASSPAADPDWSWRSPDAGAFDEEAAATQADPDPGWEGYREAARPDPARDAFGDGAVDDQAPDAFGDADGWEGSQPGHRGWDDPAGAAADDGTGGWRPAGVDTPTGAWDAVEPVGREPDYPALFGELYRRSAAQQDPVWEAPPAVEPLPEPGPPDPPAAAWPFEETTQSWEPSDRSFIWPPDELPSTPAEWDQPAQARDWLDDPAAGPAASPEPDQTAAWPGPGPGTRAWEEPAADPTPEPRAPLWGSQPGSGNGLPPAPPTGPAASVPLAGAITPAPPPPPAGPVGPPPDDWASAIPTDVPAARRAADPSATTVWPGDEAADAEPGVPLGPGNRPRPAGVGGARRERRAPRDPRGGATELAGAPGTRTAPRPARGSSEAAEAAGAAGATPIDTGKGRRNGQGGERQARAWPRVVAVISWIVLVMVLCWYYVFPWLERVLPENF